MPTARLSAVDLNIAFLKAITSKSYKLQSTQNSQLRCRAFDLPAVEKDLNPAATTQIR